MTQWGLQDRDLPHCRARPWLPLQVIGEGGTHHASRRHPRPRGSSWQPCPCWKGRELLGRVGCLGEQRWLTITLCKTKPLEHSWSVQHGPATGSGERCRLWGRWIHSLMCSYRMRKESISLIFLDFACRSQRVFRLPGAGCSCGS